MAINILGDAKLFLPSLLDQLVVKRHNDLHGFRLDEVLNDHLRHELGFLEKDFIPVFSVRSSTGRLWGHPLL